MDAIKKKNVLFDITDDGMTTGVDPVALMNCVRVGGFCGGSKKSIFNNLEILFSK